MDENPIKISGTVIRTLINKQGTLEVDDLVPSAHNSILNTLNNSANFDKTLEKKYEPEVQATGVDAITSPDFENRLANQWNAE